jgi:UDP-sugar transporter A1/2/3
VLTQVTYQLKILTTAVFSVVILQRSLSLTKWASLVLLTVAVALVQVSNVKHSSEEEEPSQGSLPTAVAGLLAVGCASITSGLAGVYTEKILKGTDTSMWIRNVQLALFSLAIGMGGVFVSDRHAVLENGFFQGYSSVVLLVICLQALGGIIVAAVMKYADNILKGFAAALSIVLSSVISYFILNDFNPSMSFLLGVIFLLVSTALYNYPQTQHSPLLPLHVSKPPKAI